MKFFRYAMAMVALTFVASATLGCNTFKGMGKDVEKGGEKIQEGASDVQQDMKN